MQVRKLPKVNADEHVRLQAASISGKDSERKPVKQAAIAAEAILQDERFAAMFEDPAFSIDVHSKEYQELHPSACAFSETSQKFTKIWMKKGLTTKRIKNYAGRPVSFSLDKCD
jgi:hypothetical protein